jgi:hypothetical protein
MKIAKRAAVVGMASIALLMCGNSAGAAEPTPHAGHHLDGATSTDSPRTGTLRANEWTKVVWGAGWFSANYSIRWASPSGARPSGDFACYTVGLPLSSGEVHNGFAEFSLKAYAYAECWVRSPIDVNYEILTRS